MKSVLSLNILLTMTGFSGYAVITGSFICNLLGYRCVDYASNLSLQHDLEWRSIRCFCLSSKVICGKIWEYSSAYSVTILSFMTCFELLLWTWHQILFLQLKHLTWFYILVWYTLWLKILWWYTMCVCSRVHVLSLNIWVQLCQGSKTQTVKKIRGHFYLLFTEWSRTIIEILLMT
jgi:hypothetical protein